MDENANICLGSNVCVLHATSPASDSLSVQRRSVHLSPFQTCLNTAIKMRCRARQFRQKPKRRGEERRRLVAYLEREIIKNCKKLHLPCLVRYASTAAPPTKSVALSEMKQMLCSSPKVVLSPDSSTVKIFTKKSFLPWHLEPCSLSFDPLALAAAHRMNGALIKWSVCEEETETQTVPSD